MSSARGSEPTGRTGGTSVWQNERVRRLVLYAAVLLGLFLLGELYDPYRRAVGGAPPR